MKVTFTIEPRWTIHRYTGAIEIPDEDVEGLERSELEEIIAEVVTDAVNDQCPWGWEIEGEE